MRKTLFISMVFILAGCNAGSTDDITEYDQALSEEEIAGYTEAASIYDDPAYEAELALNATSEEVIEDDTSYEEPLATTATATYADEEMFLDEYDGDQLSYNDRMTANDRNVSFIDYQQTLAIIEEDFSSVYLAEDSEKTQEDPREMLGEQRKMPSLLVSSKFDDDYDKAMKGDPQAQYNLGLILSRKENLRQQKAQAREYFGKACAQGVQKSCNKYKTMKNAGF